jgi:hypothetical protein
MGAEEIAGKTSKSELIKKLHGGGRTWDCVEEHVAEISGGEIHIEKVAFARSVISVLPTFPSPEAIATFSKNMTALFHRLGVMQRAALRERSTTNISRRIDRARKAFIRDHPNAAKRENVLVLLENIKNALDNSREGDETRFTVQQLRRDFHLEDDLTSEVENYPKFLEALEALQYTGRLSSQSG